METSNSVSLSVLPFFTLILISLALYVYQRVDIVRSKILKYHQSPCCLHTLLIVFSDASEHDHIMLMAYVCGCLWTRNGLCSEAAGGVKVKCGLLPLDGRPSVGSVAFRGGGGEVADTKALKHRHSYLRCLTQQNRKPKSYLLGTGKTSSHARFFGEGYLSMIS